MEYAHSVEGNLQSVELSRYIDKVPQPNNTEVHAVNKKFRQKCHDVTPARQKTGDCESESSQCDKCGLNISQRNALLLENSATSVAKTIIMSDCVVEPRK